jgi:hypothetical protein
MKTFKTCKIVTLGNGLRSSDAFRAAFRRAGIALSDNVDAHLDRFTGDISTRPIKRRLVFTTVRNLGFRNSMTQESVYRRAAEYGLTLCPKEAVLQLLLQHKVRLLKGRFIYMVTKVIRFQRCSLMCVLTLDVGHPLITEVDCYRGRYLDLGDSLVFASKEDLA